jgi:hypothetical protein
MSTEQISQPLLHMNVLSLLSVLKAFDNKVVRKIFGPNNEELTEDLKKLHNAEIYNLCSSLIIVLLSLSPQPSSGIGLLHKIQLNFLEASQQFSFLQGRVVSRTPNPHPGGPGLCIYIPQKQGGYQF